jgi:hypothetical protein
MTTAAPTRRSTRGAAPFAAAAVLFVAYPALRPWGDAATGTAAEAFSSPLWLVAHLSAAAAFVLVGFGLQGFGERSPGRASAAASALWWVGAALTLTYYGAETFALNALGALVSDPAELAALAEAIRLGPTQVTVFGIGLLLMAASAVVLAVAVRPWALAVPFAAGMVLFLPQFFTSPTLRITHGVVLAIGCLLLAAHLAGRATPAPR